MKITFTLNGDVITADVPVNETLLDTLRYRIGVKSPKCGCDRGDCGTCTMMINSTPGKKNGRRTVRSCLILGVEVDGLEVITLEGVMQEAGGLTPLQKMFHEKNSFQCGFCAPGMIMSATELVQKHPSPTREEIREGLAGNLCRCTGYTPIIDAVDEYGKTILDKAEATAQQAGSTSRKGGR